MKPRQGLPGDKNIIGTTVAGLRKAQGIKQKDFLAKLQTLGLDISSTSFSRLEGQDRYVLDYELVIIARALNCPVETLLNQGMEQRR